jgi:hypothetical protein
MRTAEAGVDTRSRVMRGEHLEANGGWS